MKDKKLPDIEVGDLISFNFMKTTVSEEKIKKHWESIAKKLFAGTESSNQPSEAEIAQQDSQE